MAASGSKYNKRADGNYQHAITIGRKDDGRPIRKLLYAKTIKELDEKIREFENERQRGVLPLSKDVTFAELSERGLRSISPRLVRPCARNTVRCWISILCRPLARLRSAI